MKILLIGDYQGYHEPLAHGLRKLGHQVDILSDSEEVKSDIKLSHGKGRIAEAMFLARLSAGAGAKLKGYDIVQLASPEFLDLSGATLLRIISRLKKDNGAVCLTAMRPDATLVTNLCGDKPAIKYSAWHTPKGLRPRSTKSESGNDEWLNTERRKFTDEIYLSVDGIVAARYEYFRIIEAAFPDKALAYGGIPIVEGSYGDARKRDFTDRFSILLTNVKNSDDISGQNTLNTMLQMAEVHSRTNFRRVLIPPMSFSDYVGEMQRCEMIGEDIYSMSPGRTALAAMSCGIVPICGAEEEFYKFIGEEKLRPAFNPDPDHVKPSFKELATLLTEPEKLAEMSAEGPEFVRRHNDATVVAQRFIDFWNKTK